MKKDKILIILPTKQRIDDFKIFAKSWIDTTEGKSDVLVAIDNDDDTYDNIFDDYPFIFERVNPNPFIVILNGLAIKYCQEYKYIAFMEDDCNFVTPGWETAFISKLQEIGDYGIVWGNDLINKNYIVGLPFMDSKIIEVLGYMAPPEIKYLWVDHFWKKLGEDLNTLHYFPNIIVEHRHYITGKRQKDNISNIVDSFGITDRDAYQGNYLINRYQSDLNKLKNARS